MTLEEAGFHSSIRVFLDAHGKMEGNAHTIKGTVFPFDDAVTVERIQDLCDRMSKKAPLKSFRGPDGGWYLHDLGFADANPGLRRLGADNLPSFKDLTPNSGTTPGVLPEHSGPEVEVEVEVEEKNSAPAEDAGTPAGAGDQPAVDPKKCTSLTSFGSDAEDGADEAPDEGAEKTAKGAGKTAKGKTSKGSKGSKKDRQEGAGKKSLPRPAPPDVDPLDIQEVYDLYAKRVRPYYDDEDAKKNKAFGFIETVLGYCWSVKEIGTAINWFAKNGGAKNPDPKFRTQCHTFFNPKTGDWAEIAGEVRKQLNEQKKEAANG